MFPDPRQWSRLARAIGIMILPGCPLVLGNHKLPWVRSELIDVFGGVAGTPLSLGGPILDGSLRITAIAEPSASNRHPR